MDLENWRVVVGGEPWSARTLYSPSAWPPGADATQIQRWGQRVVEQFHWLAEANGLAVRWVPETADVLAAPQTTSDTEIDSAVLTEYREQAYALVWEQEIRR